ncbi:hypothetical protein [Streptomyces lushanensis]|uniref:hypothetical protein n=1 Tax=Streptomyces lushanensis TaxID=1434255 RepID=UPI000836E2FB|nr:hypothetical protein [Streptomyces lushanensis]
MRLSWKNAAASGFAALAVTVSGTGATAMGVAPGVRVANSASVGGTQTVTATHTPATHPADDRTFVSTTATNGTETTLRVTLDANPDGSPLKLSRAERDRIAAIVGAPTAGREAAQKAPAAAVHPAGPTEKRKAPATLRCDRNPSWSDANGTLHARFNCKYSTINWGYKISARVKSFITSKVNERGVSWWNNGTRKPRNAGHVVGKSYHFHGTLKPVRHGDHVQFQDYMTFRVNIGGRTGTGSITWAADVKAKK